MPTKNPMNLRHVMPFGATLGSHGVTFRLWAPGAARVDVGLGDDAARAQWLPMHAQEGGWHTLAVSHAGAGTRYRFRIDGDSVPDPASRFNPGDVHGASEVIDPLAFDWPDGAWRGRPWQETVIYELHVGTFSPEGTYRGVAERLDYLAALGVTAIELLPLADFPGDRNWGYDGVLPFAPDARYGRPEELKALVAAAHAHGLMVFIDVVYNHFGPEGNYLHRIAPAFFTERHKTPWGAAINFDGANARPVRDFFIHNALYWIEEFHVDGLRLDAVHAIVDDSQPHVLAELAEAVRSGPGRAREVHLVLENDRNEAQWLTRDEKRAAVQYSAQWNDDFHHAMHQLLTGETGGYYADYAAQPAAQLGRCLAEGFAYQGDASAYRDGERRGTPSKALAPDAFVNFLQNHDQIGNRAFGERLHQLAPAPALRTALAIVLLAPSPPLLFMGEEFGAATPFLFFCDFEPGLARAVREGRRAEFAGFPPFNDEAAAATIPDPGAIETFRNSRLDWSSIERPPHAEWLAFYRDLLSVRASAIVPLIGRIAAGRASYRCPTERSLDVRWPLDDGRTLILQAQVGDTGAPLAAPSDATMLWRGADDASGGWSAAWHLQQPTGA